MKIDKKALENFWYYHKTHTFLGLFLALIIISTVIISLTLGRQPDMYIGYFKEDFVKLNEMQNIGINLSNVIADINNDGAKKARIMCITEEENFNLIIQTRQAPLLLYNSDNIKKDAKMQLLQPLDDIISKNNINLENFDVIKLDATGAGKEQIYGISLKNSSIFKKYNVDMTDTYFTIRKFGSSDNEKEIKIKDSATAILKEVIK